jgi:hypothetical protein
LGLGCTNDNFSSHRSDANFNASISIRTLKNNEANMEYYSMNKSVEGFVANKKTKQKNKNMRPSLYA